MKFVKPQTSVGFRVLLYSTKTQTSAPSPPSPPSNSLFHLISPIRNPKTSIVPFLDQWIEAGKSVTKTELQSLAYQMKHFKRFHHALQISHWMTDQRYFDLTPEDATLRLNLIYNIHGLEHAEKYFSNTAMQLKSFQFYATLLNCYVKDKSVQKAEALMEEMRKLGIVTSFSYNVLVNLYVQTGQHDRIDILMKEMKGKGIPQNKYTLVNLLNAYVVVSDIRGMEDILNRLEADPTIRSDYRVYALAASGYIKAGLIEKALPLLKKTEKMVIGRRNKEVIEYLLTLYASTGLKDEVQRIWDSYAAGGRVHNSSYCCMISSLVKLDDIAGAEEIFKKWESIGTSYDFRVLNRIIAGYCKKGLLDKAEAAVKEGVERAAEGGRDPFASTWQILAKGYLENKQMTKVVQMTKKELSVAREPWKPSTIIVDSCLEYFEEQGDVEGIEEFVKLLKVFTPLTRDVYHKLLRMYVAASKPVSDVISRMKEDGLSADEETEKILH